MTMRVYYPPPEDPQAPEPTGPFDDRHTVAHGYNLADLDRLARMAVARARGYSGYILDRYQAAWSAIAEHLCTANEAPDPADLITTGWQAVNAHATRNNLTWGLSGHDERRPAFTAYWTPAPTGHSPVEDRVIDVTALWQIFPTLSPNQQRALNALASTEDYRLAAAAMGLSKTGYASVISRARTSFFKLWHDGETPSKIWRSDQRRARTDSRWRRITVSELETIRDRCYHGATHEKIAAEYGISRSTVSALLSGKYQPAPDPESTS